MKRFALPMIATLALSATPALAAPPSGFMAVGTATSFATPDSPEQTTPVKFYYQGGKIRLEMHPAGSGTSIVLARRGSKQITLLDPTQKVAMVTNAQQPGAEGADGMPDLQQLMDMGSWKSTLTRSNAKHLPGSEVKGSERCSVYQMLKGKTTYKVWLSDALELPMQVEGSVAGKPKFRLTMSKVTPGAQASSLFSVPAGYQKTELTMPKQ